MNPIRFHHFARSGGVGAVVLKAFVSCRLRRLHFP